MAGKYKQSGKQQKTLRKFAAVKSDGTRGRGPKMKAGFGRNG